MGTITLDVFPSTIIVLYINIGDIFSLWLLSSLAFMFLLAFKLDMSSRIIRSFLKMCLKLYIFRRSRCKEIKIEIQVTESRSVHSSNSYRRRYVWSSFFKYFVGIWYFIGHLLFQLSLSFRTMIRLSWKLCR